MNFITGDKFKAMAHITFGDAGLRYNTDIPEQGNVIVFCETHRIADFMQDMAIRQIIPPTRKIIFVTHNSDGCITTGSQRTFDYNYSKENIPHNIIAWYAQNLDVVNGGILNPIPIGMENFGWHKGTKYVEVEFIRAMNIPRQKILYLNCELSTNPKERGECVQILSRLPNVTYRQNKISYDKYLREMAQHIFVACPDGNGLDTHRMWEALYIGCIPVAKRRVFTERLSEHFPMVLVKDWREVTHQKLMQFFRNPNEGLRTTQNFQTSLDFDYWKEKIVKGVRI